MDKEQVIYDITFALRRGTQEDLLWWNGIPAQGEPIFELDTFKLKIGDGINVYENLPYVGDNEALALLQEKVDTFLADADLSEAAVDTLKEIQNMLNDNTLDLAELVRKIAEFEELHASIKASIEKVREEFAVADQALHEAITAEQKVITDNLSVTDKKISNTITEIEAEYKAANNNLSNAIKLKADQTALEAEIIRAKEAESQALIDAKAYTNKVKNDLLGEGITETFDTLVEIQDWINGDGVNAIELTEAIAEEAAKRLVQDEALNIRLDEAIEQHYKDLETINNEFEEAYDQCVTELNTRINNEVAALQKADSDNLATAKAYTDTAKAKLEEDDRNNLAEAKAYTDAAKAALFGEGTANFDTIVKLSAKTQELIDIFPPYVAQQIANSETAMKAYIDQKIGEVENGTY